MAIGGSAASLAISLLIKVGGSEAVEKLNGIMKDTGKGAQELGSKLGELGKHSGSVSEFFNSTGKSLSEWGGKIESVGNKMSLMVTGPLMALGTYGVKVGSDFEASMSNIAAITGMTNEELKQMESGIRDIAQATGISATELATQAKMVAESGGDMNLMMSQLEQGAKLAQASQSDLATTLDFVGSAMKTFGVEAEGTQAVVDSFATVTTLANLELSQLAESYVNVSGAAASAGMSIDDVNAFLVEFSNAGLKGGAAGTTLNGVIRNLSTPTDKAKDAFKELNVALYDSQGVSRDMFDIMGDLEKALGGLTDEQKNRYESVIFDTVAQKGWNIITGEGVSEISALSKELAHSVDAFDGIGQAAGMAGVATDTFQGNMARLKTGVQDIGISIFQSLVPALTGVIQWVQNLISSFTSMDEGTKKTIVTVGAIVAAIGPAIKVFGMLVQGIGSVSTALGFLTDHPAILVIAGLAATIYGVVKAVEAWRKANDETAKSAQYLSDAVFVFDKKRIEEGLKGIDIGREAYRAEIPIKAVINAQVDEIRIEQAAALEDGTISKKEAQKLTKMVDMMVDASISEAEKSLKEKTAKYVEFVRTFTVAEMTGFTGDYKVITDIQSMVDGIGTALKDVKPALTTEQSNAIIAKLVQEPIDKWPEILRGLGFKDKAMVDELIIKVTPMVDNVKNYLSTLGIVDADTQAAMVASVTANMAEIPAKLAEVGIDTTEAQTAIIDNITGVFAQLKIAIANIATGPGFGLQASDIAALYTAYMAGGEVWTSAAASFNLSEEQTAAMESMFSGLGDDMATAVKNAASSEGFTKITSEQVTAIVSAFMAGGDAWTSATAELPEDAKTAVTNTLGAFSTKAQEALTEIGEAEGFALTPEQAKSLVKAWIEGPEAWADATADLPEGATTAMSTTLAKISDETETAIVAAGAEGGFAITPEQAKSLLDAWVSGGEAWANATADIPAEATTAIENSLKKLSPEFETALSALASDPLAGISNDQIIELIEGWLTGNWATVSANLPPEAKTAIEKALSQVGDVLKDAPPMTGEQKTAAIKAVADAIRGVITDASTQSLTGEAGMESLIAKYQEQVRSVIGELEAARTEYDALVTTIATPGYEASRQEITQMEELLVKIGLLRTELMTMDSEITGRARAAIQLVQAGKGSMEDFGIAIGYVQEDFENRKAQIQQSADALRDSTSQAVAEAQMNLTAAEQAYAQALAQGNQAQIDAARKRMEEAQFLVDEQINALASIEDKMAAEVAQAGEEKWAQIADFFNTMMDQFPEMQAALEQSMKTMDVAKLFSVGDFESLQQYAYEYSQEFGKALSENFTEDQIAAAFGEKAIEIDPNKLLTFVSSGAVDIVQDLIGDLAAAEFDSDMIVDAIGEQYVDADPNKLFKFVVSGEVDIAAENVQNLMMAGVPYDAIVEQLRSQAEDLNISPEDLFNLVVSGDYDLLRDAIGQMSLGAVDDQAIQDALGAVATKLDMDPNELFELVATGELKVDAEKIKELGINDAFAQQLGMSAAAQLSESIANTDLGEQGAAVMMDLLGTIFSGDISMEGFDTSGLSSAIGGALKLTEFIDAIKEDSKGAGDAIVAGVKEAIEADETGGAAMESYGEKLVEAFRAKLDMHSPSEVMKAEGKNIPDGVAAGIEEGADSVTTAFDAMTETLKTSAQTMVESIKQEFMNLGPEVAAVLAESGVSITDYFTQLEIDVTSAVANIIEIVAGMSAQIDQALGGAGDKAAELVEGAAAAQEKEGEPGKASGLVEKLTAMADEIKGVLDDLQQQITDQMSKITEEVGSTFGDEMSAQMLEGITAITEQVTTGFQAMNESIIATLDEGIAQMPAKGEELMTQLQSGVEAQKSTFFAALQAIANLTAPQFNSALAAMQQKGQDLMNMLRNGIESGKSSVLSSLQSLAAMIPQQFDSAVSAMGGIGQNMMNALANAIREGQSGVVNAMVAAVEAAIAAAKRAAEIASPSGATAYIGDMMVQGLVDELEKGKTAAAAAGQGLSDAALSGMGGSSGALEGGETNTSEQSPLINIENVNVYQPERVSIYETMREMRWSLEDMAMGVK